MLGHPRLFVFPSTTFFSRASELLKKLSSDQSTLAKPKNQTNHKVKETREREREREREEPSRDTAAVESETSRMYEVAFTDHALL